MTTQTTVAVNDTVICKQNSLSLENVTFFTNISTGKTYVVEDITTDGCYTIINDDEEIAGYPAELFTHFSISNSDEIPGYFEKEV